MTSDGGAPLAMSFVPMWSSTTVLLRIVSKWYMCCLVDLSRVVPGCIQDFAAGR